MADDETTTQKTVPKRRTASKAENVPDLQEQQQERRGGRGETPNNATQQATSSIPTAMGDDQCHRASCEGRGIMMVACPYKKSM